MNVAEAADLWRSIDAAMFEVKSRAETLSEINRLLRKCNAAAPCAFISESSAQLTREFLTTAQLASFWRGHLRTGARRYHLPIIIAEFRGTSYVLDGTRRINEWVEFGDTERHESIIIKVVGQS